MERPDNLQPDERQLWGHYAALGCPSPILLAALIDGELEDVARSEIERHVSACPECRSAVAETRTLMKAQLDTPMEAPAEVVSRAKALVRPLPVLVPVVEIGVAGRLGLRRFGRWGLSAAASIAVCLVGYQAGALSSAATMPANDLVTELTFGIDVDAATDLDFFLGPAGGTEAGS